MFQYNSISFREECEKLADTSRGAIDIQPSRCHDVDGTSIDYVRAGVGHTRRVVGVLLPHPEEVRGLRKAVRILRKCKRDPAWLEDNDIGFDFVSVSSYKNLLNRGWIDKVNRTFNDVLRFHYRDDRRYVQPEYTFPISYKTLEWNTPTQGATAIMNLLSRIEDEKCEALIYDAMHDCLLNTGAEFFVSGPGRDEIVRALKTNTERSGLPLSRGMAESFYSAKLEDGFFEVPLLRRLYDGFDGAGVMGGGCPADHLAARRDPSPTTAVYSEPYAFRPDARLMQRNLSGMTHREVIAHAERLTRSIDLSMERAADRAERLDDNDPLVMATLVGTGRVPSGFGNYVPGKKIDPTRRLDDVLTPDEAFTVISRVAFRARRSWMAERMLRTHGYTIDADELAENNDRAVDQLVEKLGIHETPEAQLDHLQMGTLAAVMEGRGLPGDELPLMSGRLPDLEKV